MWWYWYIWNSHLSYAVNHWPNFAASHSLTALVQCNYHLVVLLYLKLPFEIPNYYCTRTDNHSPARHYRLKQLSTSTKNIKSFGWKYQTFRLKILNISAENIRRFGQNTFLIRHTVLHSLAETKNTIYQQLNFLQSIYPFQSSR